MAGVWTGSQLRVRAPAVPLSFVTGLNVLCRPNTLSQASIYSGRVPVEEIYVPTVEKHADRPERVRLRRAVAPAYWLGERVPPSGTRKRLAVDRRTDTAEFPREGYCS